MPVSFDDHKQLSLLWIKGEAIPLPKNYYPWMEETIDGRLGRLNRDRAKHFGKARRESDDTLINIQPLVVPTAVPVTNLYCLMNMKENFLPWPVLQRAGGGGILSGSGMFGRRVQSSTNGWRR
jgi:hypothetical protein